MDEVRHFEDHLARVRRLHHLAVRAAFDEQRIVSLFDGAKEPGVELFLLDDGWFGNKYPRDNDRAGLGDRRVNRRKLPRGLSHLAAEAKKRGIDFGVY